MMSCCRHSWVIPFEFRSRSCFYDSSAHKNYFLGSLVKTHLHFLNTYSWPCLHQWLETRPNRQVCPVCKAAISKEKVVPLYGRGSTKQEDPRLIHFTVELMACLYLAWFLTCQETSSVFDFQLFLCNLYMDFK
jgi:hypothetical protein